MKRQLMLITTVSMIVLMCSGCINSYVPHNSFAAAVPGLIYSQTTQHSPVQIDLPVDDLNIVDGFETANFVQTDGFVVFEVDATAGGAYRCPGEARGGQGQKSHADTKTNGET